VGYVVEVGRFLGEVNVRNLSGKVNTVSDVWEIHSKSIPRKYPDLPIGLRDSYLSPIRPGDLQETDETEREVTV
jgi:hypothetical protein